MSSLHQHFLAGFLTPHAAEQQSKSSTTVLPDYCMEGADKDHNMGDGAEADCRPAAEWPS